MKFDSIVIGGGMAGLSAALLRLAETGQKATDGLRPNALHLPPAPVDLLESDGDPRAALPAFMAAHRITPTARWGCRYRGESGRPATHTAQKRAAP